jgi:hypothetical protein
MPNDRISDIRARYHAIEITTPKKAAEDLMQAKSDLGELLAEHDKNKALLEAFNGEAEPSTEVIAFLKDENELRAWIKRCAWHCKKVQEQAAELDRLTEAQRWIPVTESLPEDDPTMKMHKESHMEFCSVLAVGVFGGCEYATPTVSMVNRIRLKKTGIEYIDREIKTEDWHWSAPFESVTHWMPLPAAIEKGENHE